MKKPICVDSIVEFVVVGSIFESDGVIIKSTTNTIGTVAIDFGRGKGPGSQLAFHPLVARGGFTTSTGTCSGTFKRAPVVTVKQRELSGSVFGSRICWFFLGFC